MSPFYVVAFLKPKGSWLTCCSVLISTFTKHGRDPTKLKRRPCQRNPQRNRTAANVAGKLLIHSPYLLWMDEFAGKLPCFVGICRGSIILGFPGWCEMDFATMHSTKRRFLETLEADLRCDRCTTRNRGASQDTTKKT